MTLLLYNCRITYYRMEGYYTPHIHAPVLHIEKDLTNPNNLIIAHWSSLKILDQNFQEHLIAGQTETSGFRDGEGSNALFTWVTSFIQSDTRHVLVVDHYTAIAYASSIVKQMEPQHTRVYVNTEDITIRASHNQDFITLILSCDTRIIFSM